MSTQRTVGFEVLGRSLLFGLGTPHAMFSAAALLDLEGELSRMLRNEGVRLAEALPANPLVFLNTHPAELQDPAMLEKSLRELRLAFPEAALVLEIHEAAATSVPQMRALRCVLNELGMQLAYDDFGAGQARLAELGDAPPDYLKFDIQLIRGIDGAMPSGNGCSPAWSASRPIWGLSVWRRGSKPPPNTRPAADSDSSTARDFATVRPPRRGRSPRKRVASRHWRL